jgi:2-succinyl-6-hydroxy-2,4-cyclohexadiene-1-carboxylate synthase
MTSHFIDIDHLRYHLEIDGRGLPLVLLHGFTGSAASWSAHIDALAARFRVVRIDLPGHGRTPAPSVERCAFTRVGDDLAAILARVVDVPAPLLGYSMGGRLALYTALAHPDRIRTLILESASPGLESEAERAARRTADEVLAERILAQGVPAFVDAWEKLPLFATHARLPQPIRDAQRRQRLANDADGLAISLRALGTGVQPALWARLGELIMPALLITGDEDTKFNAIAQRMAVAMPKASHQRILQSGHTPHLEQAHAFREAVFAFL